MLALTRVSGSSMRLGWIRARRSARGGTSLAGAFAWTAGAKWGSQVLTWAATLLIVRLLTPHDYGIIALAGVILGLLTILNDFGLDLAIVAYRELTESEMAQLNVL